MHPSLLTMLEGLKDGLVWLTADAKVKFTNAQGATLSGLKPGLQLHECRLKKAVQVIGLGKLDKPVEMEFEPLAGSRPLLHAKAMPALAPGEVFVFLSPPAAYGEPLALDNLMTVLRTDLAGPLKQMSSSLSIAGDSRDPQAIEEAVTQGKALAETLARLVDLSQLWQSDSLLANDRVAIWGLLEDAWQKSRAFAETRKVTVRLVSQLEAKDMPVTYGSEFWLHRVVTESLQAALRAASPGATLDIELRSMGPRALIVFRNSGMWPATARDAVMLNDGQNKRVAPGTARPTVNAKDLIGLHLCERIINLLGGQLREEVDDGLRNFLIDLPTGAPHREVHDAALETAQAQRYAADLSSLMARRRQAKA